VIDLLNGAVRPIVTLGLAATFCYLALAGEVPIEAFVSTVSLILGFWFMQRQQAKPNGDQPHS
jgi:hypothetical protein